MADGTETNNQANNAFVKDNPDSEDPPYAAVSCDVAIQTAKPKTVEEVMNLRLGEQEGNRESLNSGHRGRYGVADG